MIGGLSLEEQPQWNSLVSLLGTSHNLEVEDSMYWDLEPSQQFSTGLLYKAIFKNADACGVLYILKTRLAAKIKI